MAELAEGEMLPGVVEREPIRIWFGQGGAVDERDDGTFVVYAGGDIIGMFDADDPAARDVLITVVALRGGARYEDIARAFRVSRPTVGRAMARYQQGGYKAVADTGHKGGHTIRTPKLQKRLWSLFEQGHGPRAAHRAVAKHASYGTVQAMHKEWLAGQAAAPAKELQLDLDIPAANDTSETDGHDGELTTATAAAEPPLKSRGAVRPSTRQVQHVGSWLMLGMLDALGIYDFAEQCRKRSPDRDTLRTAIDAVAIALSLGQRCVEGVRRIETPTVGQLLRRDGGISASWARRVLGSFAAESATLFQAKTAASLLERAVSGDNRVWLYVDNHLRPYTGKRTIRKGWRMQDKRAVPGCSDFYVHDEDGCPLWRIASPSHGSLCQWLEPVVDFVDIALGRRVTPVLIFDRGGAFPETMARLRDIGAELVTYERRPYPLLARTEFADKLWSPALFHRPSLTLHREAPGAFSRIA